MSIIFPIAYGTAMLMLLETTSSPMAAPSLYLSGKARARILLKSLEPEVADLEDVEDLNLNICLSQELHLTLKTELFLQILCLIDAWLWRSLNNIDCRIKQK